LLLAVAADAFLPGTGAAFIALKSRHAASAFLDGA